MLNLVKFADYCIAGDVIHQSSTLNFDLCNDIGMVPLTIYVYAALNALLYVGRYKGESQNLVIWVSLFNCLVCAHIG